jgi:hypothetical protein
MGAPPLDYIFRLYDVIAQRGFCELTYLCLGMCSVVPLYGLRELIARLGKLKRWGIVKNDSGDDGTWVELDDIFLHDIKEGDSVSEGTSALYLLGMATRQS